MPSAIYEPCVRFIGAQRTMRRCPHLSGAWLGADKCDALSSTLPVHCSVKSYSPGNRSGPAVWSSNTTRTLCVRPEHVRRACRLGCRTASQSIYLSIGREVGIHLDLVIALLPDVRSSLGVHVRPFAIPPLRLGPAVRVRVDLIAVLLAQLAPPPFIQPMQAALIVQPGHILSPPSVQTFVNAPFSGASSCQRLRRCEWHHGVAPSWCSACTMPPLPA